MQPDFESGKQTMKIPCPQCPDGNVWTSNGPTCKVCPRCNGLAYITLGESDEESDEDTDEVHDFCKPDAIFGMGN